MAELAADLAIPLFRAMTRKRWVQNNQVLAAAFVLREGEKGLSVDIHSPNSAVSNLRETYGVAELKSTGVRDLGLKIEVDDEPHALLIGLLDITPNEANRLASQLSRLSRFIPEDICRTQSESNSSDISDQ